MSLPPYLAKFRNHLVSELRKVGVKAEVSIEPVGRTKLHRFSVIAPEFEDMLHSERQSLVWRLADQALKPDERLTISMILTLSPGDLEPRKPTPRPKRVKRKTAQEANRSSRRVGAPRRP